MAWDASFGWKDKGDTGALEPEVQERQRPDAEGVVPGAAVAVEGRRHGPALVLRRGRVGGRGRRRQGLPPGRRREARRAAGQRQRAAASTAASRGPDGPG